MNLLTRIKYSLDYRLIRKIYPKYKRKKVVLFRYTRALGDNLFLTTLAREVKKRNPKAEISVYTGLPVLFERNPDVAHVFDETDVNRKDLGQHLIRYEHKFPWKRHLLEHSAECIDIHDAIELKTYIYPSDEDKQWAKDFVSKIGAIPILFNRKAGQRTDKKNWPDEYWNALIDRLLEDHVMVEIGTIEHNGPEHENYHSVIGQTSLHKLAALMQESKLLIGPDTGTLNLAASCALPTICILGGSVPEVSIKYPNVVCLTDRPECSNCYEQGPCDFEFRCQTAIKPERVLQQVKASTELIKVLLTINNLETAGMKYVLADLARGLDPSEFVVEVAVNRSSNSQLEKELKKDFRIHQLALKNKGGRNLKWFSFLNGSRYLREQNIDVAHSFNYESDWTEPRLFQKAGIPWIAEKTNLIYNRSWDKRLDRASKIICLSNAQVEQLGNHKSKTIRIPTGIDLHRFGAAKPVDRASLGLQEEDVLLISVAHLVEVKGHRELIQAMNKLKKQCPHLKLLFAGAGEEAYEKELQALVDQNGLEDHVIFLGRAQNIPELLKMSDGKVLATRNTGRREGFGAALVEAMAAGLPVIATKSGGPEDIVVHGETGWLVDADGIEPLIDGMKEFYLDQKKRQDYGRAGLERAQTQYGKEQMVQAYAAVYKEVASI